MGGVDLFPAIMLPSGCHPLNTIIDCLRQNVFIEATAMDEYKAIVTVNQIVAAFSYYCKEQFTCVSRLWLVPTDCAFSVVCFFIFFIACYFLLCSIFSLFVIALFLCHLVFVIWL